MVKYVFIILVIIIFFSCTQYTAVTPPKPEYILTLENNVIGVYLYEKSNQIFIQNESANLIIEIDYNINNDNIIIYDILVPNKEMFLLNWNIHSYDLTVYINNVKFY